MSFTEKKKAPFGVLGGNLALVPPHLSLQPPSSAYPADVPRLGADPYTDTFTPLKSCEGRCFGTPKATARFQEKSCEVPGGGGGGWKWPARFQGKL